MYRYICTFTTLIILMVKFPLNANEMQDQKIHIMPLELVYLAENNGYEEIDNFYSSSLPETNPPFLWGYREDLPLNQSAVFWCRKHNDSVSKDNNYYLLFASYSSHNAFNSLDIDFIIEWPHCGGLSLCYDSILTLDSFVYIDELNKKGQKGIKLQKPAIKNENEAIIELFYEYNGNWLVYMKYDW